MLSLDELTIHNFKSFKHATIKFNQGFNCIVGPNGSGKSNICDSLLFALGETSLRRMRVTSALSLINSYTKANKEDGLKRAYVKVKFSGDKDVEIIRSLKSNKKIGYRLDGKRVTRQQVLDVLNAYSGGINETNTMTQGEITYLLNLNPKERRGLIDTAAGISDFNDKRDAAMKELEKVEMKISEARILLNERSGFLSDLEKEKRDAERYQELSTNIKRSKFTLLKLREKDVAGKLETVLAESKAKTIKQQELEKRLAELDGRISSISSERERLAKSISARSQELGATNKILEEANKNIAVGNTQIASIDDSLKSATEHLDSINGELKKLKLKEKENRDKIKKMEFELNLKSQDIKEAKESSEGDDTHGMSAKFEENYKRIESYESELMTLSSDLSAISAEQEGLRRQVADAHRRLTELAQKRTAMLEKVKSNQEALATHQQAVKELTGELDKCVISISESKQKLDRIFEDEINQKELLAQLGRESDTGLEAVKKAVEGVHGRAHQLCTYDDKYALAVQAAAGSRFNYIVADSIDAANEAIGLLKKRQLGRASFIPLKQIAAKPDTEAPKGAESVLGLVKFDKKFRKAFEYIFSNTYLVGSLNEAQKLGIGRHRYVTLEGEIVEPSGVVSGGSMKLSVSAVGVEAKIKKLGQEKKEMLERIKELESTSETLRKRRFSHETEATNHDIEVKHTLNGEDEINREMESLAKEVKANESKHADAHTKIEKLKAQKLEAEKELAKMKEENVKIRERLGRILENTARSPKNKEEQAKQRELRAALEQLRVDIAAMSRETEMVSARIDELNAEHKREAENVEALRAKRSQVEADIAKLAAQKEELQETLQSHDKKTSGIIKEMQCLEEQSSKFAFEKGQLGSAREKLTRELMEMESGKGQLQTRLNDIKAELQSYQNVEPIDNITIEKLDTALIIATNELEKLGAVNLKAPEMYESRRRDVEEAQQKVNTLGSEKDSVLAMIQEIETKKMNVFNDTLNAVNENFQKLYGYIFDGHASLYLQNPKEPFTSGLLVDVEFGKKKHNSDQLSGGQKSLLMLMLIFAIQMRKPMAFYVFDEIDIALDKENSKKLSKLIKELSARSQFIVVSHNDSLISAADTAIGVVNKQNESQVVGVQLASKQEASA
jgi:chromosome segregation protein